MHDAVTDNGNDQLTCLDWKFGGCEWRRHFRVLRCCQTSSAARQRLPGQLLSGKQSSVTWLGRWLHQDWSWPELATVPPVTQRQSVNKTLVAAYMQKPQPCKCCNRACVCSFVRMASAAVISVALQMASAMRGFKAVTSPQHYPSTALSGWQAVTGN